DRRAPELDLAVVGDPHLDPLRWPPDRPEPVVVEGRAAAGPRLGGAIALEDRDAEVFPRLLERRWQERAGREEQPEMTAELPVHAPEQRGPPAHRQTPRDRPQPGERGLAMGLADLALDGAPEEVEDLRYDDHRGDLVIPQGVEDHPRVPAADIEDV